MDYLVCPNGIELKADTAQGVIEGWASTFGNIDRGGDVVERGAFDAWAADVKAGHQPLPKITDAHVEAIGVWDQVEVRSKGLFVKGAPEQELTAGRETVIKATTDPPIYDSLSIGYRVRKGGSTWNNDPGVRHLTDLEVAEVAVLAFPMNPKARITRVKRDAIVACNTIREFEHLLRDAGFGREQAKLVALSGYAGLQELRDADGSEPNEDQLTQLVATMQGMAAGRLLASHWRLDREL